MPLKINALTALFFVPLITKYFIMDKFLKHINQQFCKSLCILCYESQQKLMWVKQLKPGKKSQNLLSCPGFLQPCKYPAGCVLCDIALGGFDCW